MYYPGIFDEGLKDGYRFRVVQDVDAEDPCTWGDHVQKGDDIHTKWADGDVYGVILERCVQYVNVDDSSDLYGRWLETDSLWGCYLDAEYTALNVAREYGWDGVSR